MKTRLPSVFFNKPAEVFSKAIPAIMIFITVIGFGIRGWQFGTGTTRNFNIGYALGGVALMAVLLLGSFFAAGGRKLNQLARFVILYLAFVPNVTFGYLQRILTTGCLFTLRDDVINGRINGAIALWLPNLANILQLLIPFIILLIMTWQINEKNNGLTKQTNDSGKVVHGIKIFTDGKLPVWYIVSAVIALVLLGLTLPFANMTNLAMYIVKLICTCIIWDMWERIRNNHSLEPKILVSWAEIILFMALAFKAVVENLGL